MKKLTLVFFIFASLASISQTDSIPYSHDFEFKEGIYFTFYQFKHNHPIPVSSIISDYPKSQLDFLTEVTSHKIIEFKDDFGIIQKAETSLLWGYCRNRSVYINFNNDFNKVNVMGTLFYFTASVTCTIGVPDPMGGTTTYDELRQFVYDTPSNKVFDFNVKNMEIILKNDDELYTKFMGMKKHDKPDAIFILLRKYNEKHPFYIFK